MSIREWRPYTVYTQGDCVLIPEGLSGYMGDAGGGKTWLLCCVGTGASPDATPIGVSGAPKTRLEWATLFEGNTTDEIIGEATVMAATLQGNQSGPDGNIRWALGIAFFLDTSQPTNGNGSFYSPYNAASAISATQISSQDGTNSTRHIYVKSGTTVALTSAGAQWLGRGSSRKMRARLTDYGVGAPPVLDARLATAQAGVFISTVGGNPARFVTAENFEVYGAGGDGVSVFLGTGSAGIAQNDIDLRNIFSHDNGASGIQALTGGAVDRSTSSTGLLIENCRCERNVVYGMAVREWWDGATIINPICIDNGSDTPSGSYAISTISNYLTYTGTGWNSLGSDAWERTGFSRSNAVLTGRIRRADNAERILNPAVFANMTTEPVYSIASSGTTVRVRLGPGENPNNQPVWMCYNRVKNVRIINPVMIGQKDLRAPAGRYDGDAIGIDQFSENVTVIAPYTEGNTGCSLIANQPKNLRVIGGISVRDGAGKASASQSVAGIFISHAEGACEVLHNAVIDGYGSGVRIYGPNAAAVAVTNNILDGCADAALYGTSGVTAMVNTGNTLYRNASNALNVTLAGSDQVADPLWVDRLAPSLGLQPSSPCWRAGSFVAHGTTDRRGIPYQLPVDCGPFARSQPSRVAA